LYTSVLIYAKKCGLLVIFIYNAIRPTETKKLIFLSYWVVYKWHAYTLKIDKILIFETLLINQKLV